MWICVRRESENQHSSNNGGAPFASSTSSSSLFSLRNKPLSSPTITHFRNTKPSRVSRFVPPLLGILFRSVSEDTLLQKSPRFVFWPFLGLGPLHQNLSFFFSVVTLLDYGAGSECQECNQIPHVWHQRCELFASLHNGVVFESEAISFECKLVSFSGVGAFAVLSKTGYFF